ncbi:expressed unknown protein [Seminavis robusta]|uniref:Uncharacterized protein n=1 Tax=Seminavis robusta TaxID=568900 RepID=A0A9N8F5M3_9STRA|nr:expressed unknown protein [Seminavis robusta]|eukprot:Sro3504_g348690.1 n/a (191) ;mRNA; r:1334-1906
MTSTAATISTSAMFDMSKMERRSSTGSSHSEGDNSSWGEISLDEVLEDNCMKDRSSRTYSTLDNSSWGELDLDIFNEDDEEEDEQPQQQPQQDDDDSARHSTGNMPRRTKKSAAFRTTLSMEDISFASGKLPFQRRRALDDDSSDSDDDDDDESVNDMTKGLKNMYNKYNQRPSSSHFGQKTHLQRYKTY